MTFTLKAPFPWFGGKSRVARPVWERFGNPINYVEPFAGSLAVLLGRPGEPGNETVNDKDCYLANFWRALQADPKAVAHHADWPVNECDLQVRHQWLVDQTGFVDRMKSDPEYFDVKIAGWWVWGISQWIGSGWCSRPDWTGRGNASRSPRGVNARRPALQYMLTLSERLRRVRVCCGDWTRILGPAPTTSIGVTAVFLDPLYAVEERKDVYNEDSREFAHQVRAWAIENGSNPLLRIALCGYEGEHLMPDTWECVAWKANGGYGNNQSGQTQGNENAHRERIWFSPHCLKQPSLFQPLEFLSQVGPFAEKNEPGTVPGFDCVFPNHNEGESVS